MTLQELPPGRPSHEPTGDPVELIHDNASSNDRLASVGVTQAIPAAEEDAGATDRYHEVQFKHGAVDRLGLTTQRVPRELARLAVAATFLPVRERVEVVSIIGLLVEQPVAVGEENDVPPLGCSHADRARHSVLTFDTARTNVACQEDRLRTRSGRQQDQS